MRRRTMKMASRLYRENQCWSSCQIKCADGERIWKNSWCRRMEKYFIEGSYMIKFIMYIYALFKMILNDLYRVMKAYLLLATMLSPAHAHPARLHSRRLLTGQAQKRKQIWIFQSSWVTGCLYVKAILELSDTLETWIASILMTKSMLVWSWMIRVYLQHQHNELINLCDTDHSWNYLPILAW